MAESEIKVRATLNEVQEKFLNNLSDYYELRYYEALNTEEKFINNKNELLLFKIIVRHNEIGENRTVERKKIYTFDEFEDALLKKIDLYIKNNIENVEKKFAQINKLDKNVSKIINDCFFILEGIDLRNKKTHSRSELDGEFEKYPEWANQENVDLIDEWKNLQNKLFKLEKDMKKREFLRKIKKENFVKYEITDRNIENEEEMLLE